MLAVISKLCKPSDYWLGKFSTKTQIKNGKLWLSQHLNSVKTHFGIVPSKWEIDSRIRWIEASRGSHIVKYVKDEQDKFILEFIDYLNEIGIIYDKSASL